MRSYPAALIQYYGAAVERCQVLSRLYGQTLSSIAALNAAGVEPSVVRVITSREGAIGQRREFFIEMGRFADLSRTALIHRRSPDNFDEIISGMLSGAVTGLVRGGADGAMAGVILGGLQAAAKVISNEQTEKEAISNQITLLTATLTQLRRDIVEYQTKYAQLTTELEAKYSDQDWSFMVSKQPVNVRQ